MTHTNFNLLKILTTVRLIICLNYNHDIYILQYFVSESVICRLLTCRWTPCAVAFYFNRLSMLNSQ